MNKQQLAAKIWESANKMRSKIEANEYKDYILGFIFYKFLSEKELKYLIANDWTDEYLPDLKEDDTETVQSIQKNLGYFIAYEHLFSTWIAKGKEFSVSDVRDALSAFTRLINPTHKKVFEGIFDTLQTGLSKLGESAAAQSKSIHELIYLIKDIPMDPKQGYDVLGFIYEYLIEKFAANAGKKAGEFYTPHEVSLLMSEIVAEHLKTRDKIEIFDPTSGSGSLLINIGKSASKYIEGKNRIKYYAQELKQNTYNLTRMNLIMRGIEADNIVTRNADTLEDDWPYFDESDPLGTYEPLYVDAVVSNPPYSQAWNPENKDADPRYAGYGIAPKGKADYAFLLHDLYHIKPEGIMTIVLPHGVLFRGGEEGEIRKNLIEKNKIDAIIGLPANIFYGTGIPTVILVLKQKRSETDLLIVDASKGFIKEGKNNKLRAYDIKRIVDAVVERKIIEKFSRLVSRDEIRSNDYNLNIPRYVDSSDAAESWDIYASMFGGIPDSELDQLKEYWDAFPTLRASLFTNASPGYAKLLEGDLKCIIKEHPDLVTFKERFKNAFFNLDEYLHRELILKMNALNISKTEEILAEHIFARLEGIPLMDRYEAYQLLDDDWVKVAIDLEIIQSEGIEAARAVDPNMVIKKKDGREQELQEGWKGRILPFELVQKRHLIEELEDLKKAEERAIEITSEYGELMDALSEEEKQKILNDDDSAFLPKELGIAHKEIMDGISIEEEQVLEEYLKLKTQGEKSDFVERHGEIRWNEMIPSKNGTYGKSEIGKYILSIKAEFRFAEDSFEYVVSKASKLMQEEKNLKKMLKEKADALHLKSKALIEALSEEDIVELLKDKWIAPFIQNVMQLPEKILDDFCKKLEFLGKKYETTFSELEAEIKETERALSEMLDELEGNDFDMPGVRELKRLLGGE